jgi:hypothetical protein
VLSVLHRFTDYNDPFGIFKFFIDQKDKQRSTKHTQKTEDGEDVSVKSKDNVLPPLFSTKNYHE